LHACHGLQLDRPRRFCSTTRFWTLDPIDGTKGFLRGDQYAVALALVDNGRVQIGVLGCPNLCDGYRPDHGGEGSIAIAVRDQGSWVASLVSPRIFDRMHASRRLDPSTARLLRSFESGHTNPGQIDGLANALGFRPAQLPWIARQNTACWLRAKRT